MDAPGQGVALVLAEIMAGAGVQQGEHIIQARPIESTKTIKRLHGTNVRVHVVGPHTFCTEIDSDGLDYRYATRDGGNTTLRDTTLDATTRWRCSAAAQGLGLPFAGLDLMLADDGQTYCFEVNPSPGFSWYEDATGQPIARTLARWLAGLD